MWVTVMDAMVRESMVRIECVSTFPGGETVSGLVAVGIGAGGKGTTVLAFDLDMKGAVGKGATIHSESFCAMCFTDGYKCSFDVSGV